MVGLVCCTELAGDNTEGKNLSWSTIIKTLFPLLVLTIVGQFALTMFEGTFALFAQAKFDFGPSDVGYVFVVCGLVMTVFQVGAVGLLAKKFEATTLITAGFAIMGVGIGLLATAQTKFLIYAFVAILSVGMALIAPNLAALVSKRSSEQQAGMSLGVQSAASSLGQVVGPLLGGLLFIWQVNAPYLAAALLLLVVAFFVGWKMNKNSPSL